MEEVGEIWRIKKPPQVEKDKIKLVTKRVNKTHYFRLNEIIHFECCARTILKRRLYKEFLLSQILVDS